MINKNFYDLRCVSFLRLVVMPDTPKVVMPRVLQADSRWWFLGFVLFVLSFFPFILFSIVVLHQKPNLNHILVYCPIHYNSFDTYVCIVRFMSMFDMHLQYSTCCTWFDTDRTILTTMCEVMGSSPMSVSYLPIPHPPQKKKKLSYLKGCLFYGHSVLDMQITKPDLHLDSFCNFLVSTGCSEGKRRKACRNTERSTKPICTRKQRGVY